MIKTFYLSRSPALHIFHQLICLFVRATDFRSDRENTQDLTMMDDLLSACCLNQGQSASGCSPSHRAHIYTPHKRAHTTISAIVASDAEGRKSNG